MVEIATKLNLLKDNLSKLPSSKKHISAVVVITVLFAAYRFSSAAPPMPAGPSEAERIIAEEEAKAEAAMAESAKEEGVKKANFSGSNINADLIGDMLKSPGGSADDKGKGAKDSKKLQTGDLDEIERSLGLR